LPHLMYVEQNGYGLYFGKTFENVINYSGRNPTNITNSELFSQQRG